MRRIQVGGLAGVHHRTAADRHVAEAPKVKVGMPAVKALSLFSVSAKSAWQHGMVNLLGAGPLIAET
jgi:hypothetical protein